MRLAFILLLATVLAQANIPKINHGRVLRKNLEEVLKNNYVLVAFFLSRLLMKTRICLKGKHQRKSS